MQNWNSLEGYHNGSIYSRMSEVYFEDMPETLVLCSIPRLFTPHCANELKLADDIYQEFKDAGIKLIFCSMDSPEVAEQYFGANPVNFPFIRVNRGMDYDLGVTDRFLDSSRATWYIKDNEVKDVVVHAFDFERDFWDVLQKAKQVLL